MKKVLLSLLSIMWFSYVPANAYINNAYEISDKAVKMDEGFINDSDKIIKRMESTLKTIPKSENININYLNSMIALHSEEIQLSIAIQGYSNNSQLIQFANTLLNAQNGELREMRIIRDELKNDKTISTEDNKKYMDSYTEIQKKRFDALKNYKVTGNNEVDYLNIIKINDEADIEISKAFLNYPGNDTLKRVAQNIINIKSNQIKESDRLLSSFK